MAMRIELADEGTIPRVMEIFSRCIYSMREQGIYQWDEIYPDLESVVEDARSQSLFVARQDERCVGSVCLNRNAPEQYRSVSWSYPSMSALVVHRLCVDPQWQRQGVARQLMDFAEQFAQLEGYAIIRLDAYLGNPTAIQLYERRGYQRMGEVHFPRRPLPFACFELRIEQARN